MGYNREDFVRIKAEYSEKYRRAREKADERRFELYGRIPEVKDIDSVLSGTGLEIMRIISSGKKDTEAEVEALKARNEELLARRNSLLVANGYSADYSDVKYECEKCGDTGYVGTKMCDCMKKALVLAGYESSGLGGLIRTQSFENFSLEYYRGGGANYENMEMFVGALKRFASDFDANTYRNYLLLGSTGLGKTHLSTAVAKKVIERGYDVLYVSAVGMIGDFEARRFGTGAGDGSVRGTERYYEADLLIIDDLGTEVVNQFTVSCLYDVINSRINNRKCTFINTNLSRKEIEDKYTERITSRLFGEYYPLPFAGTDIRRQKRMK
ncbi:MAG: ATP-binding protein [Clostridia bacterium]|nr:ATP-binding protein [Clostridia bacterium]